MRLSWLISTPAMLVCVATALAAFQFADATPAKAQSLSACDSYAHSYARSRMRGAAVGGMATSALVGAGIGSLVDGRRGARRGATIGLGGALLTGSLAANDEYERLFNRAFRRCMRI